MQRIGLFGGSFDPVHKGHIQIAAGVAAYCNFDEVRFLPCAQHALGKAYSANGEQRLKMLELAISRAGLDKLTIDSRELAREGVSYTVTTCQEMRKEVDSDVALGFIIGSDNLSNLHRWHEWESLLELVNLVIVERAQTELAANSALGSGQADSSPHHPMQVDVFQSAKPVTAVQRILASAVDELSEPFGQLIRVKLPPYPISSTRIRNQLALLYSELLAIQPISELPGGLEAMAETGRMNPRIKQCLQQLQPSIDEDVLAYIVEHQLYSASS